LSAVVTVKVLLVSLVAKLSVPVCPFAAQFTVSVLATLSPLAKERVTVNVSEEPSVADAAFALIE
jgi:hypothetical protein